MSRMQAFLALGIALATLFVLPSGVNAQTRDDGYYMMAANFIHGEVSCNDSLRLIFSRDMRAFAGQLSNIVQLETSTEESAVPKNWTMLSHSIRVSELDPNLVVVKPLQRFEWEKKERNTNPPHYRIRVHNRRWTGTEWSMMERIFLVIVKGGARVWMQYRTGDSVYSIGRHRVPHGSSNRNFPRLDSYHIDPMLPGRPSRDSVLINGVVFFVDDQDKFDKCFLDAPASIDGAIFTHWESNDPKVNGSPQLKHNIDRHCDDSLLHALELPVRAGRANPQHLWYHAQYMQNPPVKHVVVRTDEHSSQFIGRAFLALPTSSYGRNDWNEVESFVSNWPVWVALNSDARNFSATFAMVPVRDDSASFDLTARFLPALAKHGSMRLISNVDKYNVAVPHSILSDNPQYPAEAKVSFAIKPDFEPDTLFLDFRLVPNSPATVVENISQRLVLAPNPSNGSTVRLDLPAEVYQRKTRITIVDIVGRTIATYDADNATSLELDCSTFPSGTYQVHLQAGPWFGSKPLHIVR